MIRSNVPLRPLEGVLLVAIITMGMIGCLALYERHLAHQDLIQQEMRGAL